MPRSLAERAYWLNPSWKPHHHLPRFIVMTDTKRLSDPRGLIPHLPAGSAIIVRQFSTKLKLNIILNIIYLCRKHKVKLLVSDEPKLAFCLRLDGVHFSQTKLKSIAACGRFKKPRPDFITTSACHDFQALQQAKQAKVDGILISPIFATQSHRGARSLGMLRARNIARQTHLQAYALGGLNEQNLRHLKASPFKGIAGISLFQ